MFGKRSDVGTQQTPVPPVPQTTAPNGDAFAGGADGFKHQLFGNGIAADKFYYHIDFRIFHQSKRIVADIRFIADD